jgi:hypothetical protein
MPHDPAHSAGSKYTGYLPACDERVQPCCRVGAIALANVTVFLETAPSAVTSFTYSRRIAFGARSPTMHEIP